MLASNESPFAPMADVVQAARPCGRRRAPLPGPVLLVAAPRAVADRYGVPADRDRARQRLLRLLLAAGEALLEPGAEVVYALARVQRLSRTWRRRPAPAPSRCRSTRRKRHDLDAIAAEVTVATRLVLDLQPEQPDLDRGRSRRGAGAARARAAPRLRDPRRGVLRVLADARRPAGVGRAAPALAEPRPPAHLLQGLRPCGPARSATRCAAARSSAPPSTRSASRSTSTPPRRRPPSRRSAIRTRSSAGSSRDDRGDAPTWPTGSARSDCGSRESDANFIWLRCSTRRPIAGRSAATVPSTPRGCARGLRGEVVDGSARARRARPRRRARSAGAGAMRVTVGTDAECARFTDALRALVAG